MRFKSDVRRFPFDTIVLSVSFSNQCFDNTQAEPHINEMMIVNNIDDYQLVNSGMVKAGDEQRLRFVLQRNSFLVYLAVFVFLIAFASSIWLIIRASEKSSDFSLRAYFVGLWGIRSILMSPIQSVKAFPTLIEVTILFLFGFTVVGIGLMRFLATRTKPEKFDWPQL